jgi:cation:H+ antiporter
VVGSNLFNLLGIGGVTALVQPVDLGGIKALDLGAMLVTSAILLPLMHTGSRLVRWEGAVLFASFVAYLWLIWP